MCRWYLRWHLSNGSDLSGVRPGCERWGEFIRDVRSTLKTEFKNLAILGIAPGSQPIV